MERGTVEHHEIFLSGLRVGVQSSCAKTNRYLRRHWSGATQPIVEPDADCRFDVIADESPRIVVNGEVLWSDCAVEDLVAGFEERLYRFALARHRPRFAVFHAAAMVSDAATIVVSGPSGAGKSSLALAAVRRGWRYFSDEFVVTDGERVWGWPRAIRFDPPEHGASRPDYLADLDADLDAVESEHELAPPYFAVSADALQREASAARGVHFVSIRRDEYTGLTPLAPALGLKHWTEAAFFEPPVSLGALVGKDRAWSASWRHPDELIDLIEAI